MSVSRFVLDWKGLGRERVGGGRHYLCASRQVVLVTSATCHPAVLCCEPPTISPTSTPTPETGHICLHSCRPLSTQICLFGSSGFCGIWNHLQKLSYQTVIFATGQPTRLVHIICKTRDGYAGPAPLQCNGSAQKYD